MHALLADAEVQSRLQASRSSEFMQKVEADLGLMRSRTLQLSALLKSKDKEVERLTKAVEATRGSEHDAASEMLRLQEELRRAEGAAPALRQQLLQAEGAAKSRSREAERLTKQLEAAQAAEAGALVQQLQVRGTRGAPALQGCMPPVCVQHTKHELWAL